MNNAPSRPSVRNPVFAMLAASLVVAAGSGFGCAAASDPAHNGPEYPTEKAQSGTLDIQVVRDETSIRVTNTTARKFGRSRLWLNRWYSREIEGFDIGQTLSFGLEEFKDAYGQSFRAGGFFATRDPERLVQAQLETADSVIGLIVVARGEE